MAGTEVSVIVRYQNTSNTYIHFSAGAFLVKQP